MKTPRPSDSIKARIRKTLVDPAKRHELMILRTMADLGKRGSHFIAYSVVAAAYEHVLADRALTRSRRFR